MPRIISAVSAGLLRWYCRATVDKLPVELHLPGYKFCGPGTRLNERLDQEGINTLDSKCRDHDIAYADPKADNGDADFYLYQNALHIQRTSKSIAEKISASAVSVAMAIKMKLEFCTNAIRSGKKIKFFKNFHIKA